MPHEPSVKNETLKLDPYQQEVRQMLVIDQTALNILTPEEIREIEQLGLKFGERPERSYDIFFIECLESELGNTQTSYQAMIQRYIRLVFFSRRIIEQIKAKGWSVIDDIRTEIIKMETAWLNSPYYR